MVTEKKSPRVRRTKKVIENEAREHKHKLIYVLFVIGVIYCIVSKDAIHTTEIIAAQNTEIQKALEQNTQTHGGLKPTDKKFVGILQSYDISCFSDGVCSIVVSGVKVIETIGGRQMQGKPLGRLIGITSIRDFKDHIGEKVEVYAEPQPNGDYSLYGSRNYYIKLMKY